MNTPSKTTALKIVQEHQDKTQFLHDFLEFLGEKDVFLGRNVVDEDTDEEWTQLVYGRTLDDFMYEFIGTSAKEVEAEREALLKALQS